MHYVGSKAKLIEFIRPHIEQHINDKTLYVEPFVGGANSFLSINAKYKYGVEFNPWVVEYHQWYSKTYKNPIITYYTRDDYYNAINYVKGKIPLAENIKREHIPLIVFDYGFRALFLGGWGADNNTQIQRLNNSVKQWKKWNEKEIAESIRIEQGSYSQLDLTSASAFNNVVMYLDPPYENTNAKYKKSGDYSLKDLEDMCFKWIKQHPNVHIYLSEHKQPSDNWVVLGTKGRAGGITNISKDISIKYATELLMEFKPKEEK